MNYWDIARLVSKELSSDDGDEVGQAALYLRRRRGGQRPAKIPWDTGSA